MPKKKQPSQPDDQATNEEVIDLSSLEVMDPGSSTQEDDQGGDDLEDIED